MSQLTPAPRLMARGICKDYAVRVLDRVGMELRAGEIHALLGANGAGKSTLCRIIAGLTPATEGSMLIDGQPYSPRNKHIAEACGVQIVQQELNLIPTLSVAENLLLNRLPTRCGLIRRRELQSRARRVLDQFGLQDVSTDTSAGSLGIGQQQMVEIAAALDRDCRILILDEPTAALSNRETERLFEWLRRLRRRGVGVIYISHRLEEVARLADRVTILRDGRTVCTRATDSITTDDMVAWMTGDAAAGSTRDSADYHSFCSDRAVLRVASLSREPAVRDVSFTVHAGERLGIAGLVGSGRTELLRAIFGADAAQGGAVFLGDDPTPHRFRHPSQAVRCGLAMITEGRKQNGLLLPQPVRVNTTLCNLSRLRSPLGLIRRRAEIADSERMRRAMETHCTSLEQPVGTLSGGNQQKVAVAKWLERDARVFLFDEPTRGIDIAARQRIYQLLETLARDGKGLVIVSSDTDELFETCDRIAVMSNGRLIGSWPRSAWSRETIMQATFAGYASGARRNADS